MGTRRELHNELKSILGTTDKSGDEARCYFQPPESIKMGYPCFVYGRESPHVMRADNLLYRRIRHYGLTYVTYEPDDPIIEEVEEHFPMCRLTRSYMIDNLNHYYYDLYY